MADSAPAAIDSLERAFLGSLFTIDAEQKTRFAAALSLLPAEALSARALRSISAAQAILNRDDPLTVVVLRAELAARNELDSVGDDWLLSLLDTPILGMPEIFAPQLRRMYAKTKCARIAADIQRLLAAGLPLNGELEQLALAENDATIPPAPPAEPKILTGEELENLTLGSIDWALYPLLSRGALTLLHGNPKAGKSVFALYCALMIAKGTWTAGIFEIPKARSVLYVAYEDNLRRIRDRLIAYNTPLNLGRVPALIHFYEIPPDLALENPSLVATLVQTIRKYKIEALFIDTLTYAHRADENKAVEMQPVMAATRKLCAAYDLAICLIHHSRKAGAKGDDAASISKVRGSGVIGAAPDHVLLWGSRVEPDVTHCLYESKDVASTEWHVRYQAQPAGVVWRIEPATEDNRIAEKKLKVLMTVTNLCLTQPTGISRADVAETAAAGSVAQVGRYLAEMATPGGPLTRHRTGQTWFYHPSKLNKPDHAPNDRA